MKKFVKLDTKDIKNTVSLNTGVMPDSVGLSLKRNDGTIRVYKNILDKKGIKEHYILVSAEYNRDKKEYDIGNMEIYKVTSDIDLEFLESAENDQKYCVPINHTSVSLVYPNNNIEKKAIMDKEELSNGLTIREEVCIRLKVPESGTTWIDELIKKSLTNGKK